MTATSVRQTVLQAMKKRVIVAAALSAVAICVLIASGAHDFVVYRDRYRVFTSTHDETAIAVKRFDFLPGPKYQPLPACRSCLNGDHLVCTSPWFITIADFRQTDKFPPVFSDYVQCTCAESAHSIP